MCAKGVGITSPLLAALLALALPAAAQQVPKGFAPCDEHSIAATSPSSNIQLSKCGPSVILMNIGTQEAFFNVGQTAATVAAATNYSLPGGAFMLITVPDQSAAGWYVAGFLPELDDDPGDRGPRAVILNNEARTMTSRRNKSTKAEPGWYAQMSNGLQALYAERDAERDRMIAALLAGDEMPLPSPTAASSSGAALRC